MKCIFVMLSVTALLVAEDPVVSKSNVFVEIVQRGELVRKVDGYGKLVGSGKGIAAVIYVDAARANEVRPGQATLIDARALLHGVVKSISSGEGKKAITVEIKDSNGRLASGEPVVASIQIERLENVLTIERIALAQPETGVTLYKLKGEIGERVEVRLGKLGAGNLIEVRGGLDEGDLVIVTPMEISKDATRVRIQ